MQRLRITSYTLAASTLVLIVACSGGAEQKILDDFFRAARLRDNTTLGNFATVSFDPRTDGAVQKFDVVSVSEERVRPLPLKQYAQQLADAKAAEEAFSAQKRLYQNANLATIDRVTKAQAAGKAVAPRDKAVADAWAKWTSDAATHNKAVSDAQRQLGANSGIAELSMADGRLRGHLARRRGREQGRRDQRHRAPARWRDHDEDTQGRRVARDDEGRRRAGRRRPLDHHRAWTGLSGPGLSRLA
jgi:hypothetical protein